MHERVFGAAGPTANRLSHEYTDRDGDLVADPPTDSAQQITPERLVFSYVAGTDTQRQGEVWQPLMTALSEATGCPVEYLAFEDQEDQLRALKDGRLHIAGLNTGTVPLAVNACGFVPVSALARADGSFGYTMQIIVPSNSPLQKVQDLKGQRITFTKPSSNSGFKAPVVLLMQDFDLQPGRDYDYGFSTSHAESVRRIAARQLRAAPVASDLVDRTVEIEGLDPAAIRVIYESERFPPAAIGYAHNLSPAFVAAIRDVLVGYQLEDAALEGEFGPSQVSQLVAIDFKNDWSVVRRIDDAMGHVHAVDTKTAKTAQPWSD
jgi:phosphonate transport system substrate-binding protein